MEKAAEPPPDGEARKESIFWDRQQGVYLTFKRDEVRRAMLRLLLKLLIIAALALVFYVFWELPGCKDCIGFLAIGTCLVSCTGMGFLVPKVLCFGGVIAALFRGFSFNNDLGDIHIKLKV